MKTDDDALSIEECRRRAGEAADEGRWVAAMEWIQRAKAKGLRNADILADEGECLYHLGRFEEALAVFTEADSLDSEGYAAWRAAEAAHAAGKGRDEVFEILVRAVEKSPDLVGDLEISQTFAGMVDMPGYQSMVQKAYDLLNIRRDTE